VCQPLLGPGEGSLLLPLQVLDDVVEARQADHLGGITNEFVE